MMYQDRVSIELGYTEKCAIAVELPMCSRAYAGNKGLS